MQLENGDARYNYEIKEFAFGIWFPSLGLPTPLPLSSQSY